MKIKVAEITEILLAGHDGLYDAMIKISKQLLSMNITNEEQLYNFVFDYGK